MSFCLLSGVQWPDESPVDLPTLQDLPPRIHQRDGPVEADRGRMLIALSVPDEDSSTD